MSKLIDRIDETREYWSSELEVCRNELLDTVRVQNPLARLVVEFDYLLVEARAAIKAVEHLMKHKEREVVLVMNQENYLVYKDNRERVDAPLFPATAKKSPLAQARKWCMEQENE